MNEISAGVWIGTGARHARILRDGAPLQDLRLDPFAIPLTVSLEDAAYAEVHRPLSSVSVVGCIAGGQVGV